MDRIANRYNLTNMKSLISNKVGIEPVSFFFLIDKATRAHNTYPTDTGNSSTSTTEKSPAYIHDEGTGQDSKLGQIGWKRDA